MKSACHVQDLVRADGDIDTPLVQELAIGRQFPGTHHPREQCDLVPDGLKTCLDVAEVLHRQDGRRSDDGNLLAVCDGSRGSAYGDLGLPEANVTAHESIHRLARLHVAEDVGDGLGLIRSQLVGEGVDDRYFQLRVRLEHEAFAGVPPGGSLKQLVSDATGVFSGFLASPLPFPRPRFVESYLRTVSDILLEIAQTFDRHMEQRVILVLQRDVVPGDTVDRHGGHAPEQADAVIPVDDVVPFVQVLEARDGLREACRLLGTHRGLREQFLVRQDHEPLCSKPSRKGALDDGQP